MWRAQLYKPIAKEKKVVAKIDRGVVRWTRGPRGVGGWWPVFRFPKEGLIEWRTGTPFFGRLKANPEAIQGSPFLFQFAVETTTLGVWPPICGSTQGWAQSTCFFGMPQYLSTKKDAVQGTLLMWRMMRHRTRHNPGGWGEVRCIWANRYKQTGFGAIQEASNRPPHHGYWIHLTPKDPKPIYPEPWGSKPKTYPTPWGSKPSVLQADGYDGFGFGTETPRARLAGDTAELQASIESLSSGLGAMASSGARDLSWDHSSGPSALSHPFCEGSLT